MAPQVKEINRQMFAAVKAASVRSDKDIKAKLTAAVTNYQVDGEGRWHDSRSSAAKAALIRRLEAARFDHREILALREFVDSLGRQDLAYLEPNF